jgi:hypothetical protein
MLVLQVGHRVYVVYEPQRPLFASSSESIKKIKRKFDNRPMVASVTSRVGSMYVIVCDIVLVVVKEEQ